MTSTDNYRQLPERAAEREIILVLDQTGIDALDYEPGSQELLDRSEVAILNKDAINLDKASSVVSGLSERGLLRREAVLVADPFQGGEYAPVEEANRLFGLAKWSAVSRLLAYLGAKSVSITEEEKDKTGVRTELTVEGGRGPVAAKGGIELASQDKSVGQLRLNDSFVGGALDLDKARRFLVSAGLDGDPCLRDLVEMVANPGNAPHTRSLQLDLNRESKRTVDAALSLNIPVFLSLEATMDRAKETQESYRLEMEIEFHV
jgi:hypothetical protein